MYTVLYPTFFAPHHRKDLFPLQAIISASPFQAALGLQLVQMQRKDRSASTGASTEPHRAVVALCDLTAQHGAPRALSIPGAWAALTFLFTPNLRPSGAQATRASIAVSPFVTSQHEHWLKYTQSVCLFCFLQYLNHVFSLSKHAAYWQIPGSEVILLIPWN